MHEFWYKNVIKQQAGLRNHCSIHSRCKSVLSFPKGPNWFCRTLCLLFNAHQGIFFPWDKTVTLTFIAS